MADIYISLGSNVEREYHIQQGLNALAVTFNLPFDHLKFSSLFESEAVGFSGNAFLNMVIGISTSLSVEQVAALNLSVPFKHNQHRLELQIENDSDILALLETLNQQHISIARLHYGARNLEDLFLNQTQRSLRD